MISCPFDQSFDGLRSILTDRIRSSILILKKKLQAETSDPIWFLNRSWNSSPHLWQQRSGVEGAWNGFCSIVCLWLQIHHPNPKKFKKLITPKTYPTKRSTKGTLTMCWISSVPIITSRPRIFFPTNVPSSLFIQGKYRCIFWKRFTI